MTPSRADLISAAWSASSWQFPDGYTADETIIAAKSLSAGECYTCPELVGKTIPSGSFVQALAGTTNKVVIHMSGIEVT